MDGQCLLRLTFVERWFEWIGRKRISKKGKKKCRFACLWAKMSGAVMLINRGYDKQSSARKF